MTNQKSSADWLPAGWTIEVKVRKDGRKDKCYVDPSNEIKLYSKPEVFRYLNNIEINHSKSKGKKRGISKCSAVDFAVEKVVAEGLPPGWIKEMRVRKQGFRIRRDPYYTDPVSGYVFRSMKDAVRYLKTGEVGRLASKPKDKGSSNMELEDDKISSPAVVGEKLAESGINRQNFRKRSLKLVGGVKDEQNLESTCAGDCISPSEHSSAHVVGALPEKLPLENGLERHGDRKIQRRFNKLNDKKERNLPRRASKRLAGIEVNPMPELKTNNRGRRVAARRSGEAEASTHKNFGNMATPEEHAGNVEIKNKADERQGCSVVLPPGDLSIPEKHAGQVETNYEADKKPGLPLDLPLRDSWTDPCIDFAIKTLTGAIPIGDENTRSRGDSWPDPCIEFAIKTLTGEIPMGDEKKAEENPRFPLDSTFGDLWRDPCIEFAVKTLTGAIPLGDDLGVQNYFQQQQQCSSSETKGPNAGSDFCHTDGLCQQFDAAEKPLIKQQEPVSQTLSHAGNVNLQNSGDGGVPQHIERGSEECPKQTMV